MLIKSLQTIDVFSYQCRLHEIRKLFVLIICPIAIAYGMGQIIKSVCVSQYVCQSCVSVRLEHSYGRIS